MSAETRASTTQNTPMEVDDAGATNDDEPLDPRVGVRNMPIKDANTLLGYNLRYAVN